MPGNGTRLFEELMRFRPDGMTANAWVVRAGVSRNFWNDLKRHGNPSRRTLEKLLAAAGSSLAEFEALRADGPYPTGGSGQSGLGESGRDWRPAPVSPLPVIATSAAGEWREPGSRIELVRIQPNHVVAQLQRPITLAADPDAYAMTVTGESMWPRFRPGRRLAVSPAAPAAIGDDVVVLIGPELALIKELVGQTVKAIELRQFNPDLTFRVEAADIIAVQKVLGELY